MAKAKFLSEITEPTLNVLLAWLLTKRVLRGLGEVKVPPKVKKPELATKIKKPDVLLSVSGVKVIIEGKFEAPGVAAQLEAQCLERIEEGLCEICLAVQYPMFNFTTLSPTMEDVEVKLSKAKFLAWAAYVSSPQVKKMGWSQVTLNQLAEVIRSSYTSVVSEDIVGTAVESLSTALEQGAQALIASSEASVLAQKTAAAMELPGGTPEQPEPDEE